MNHPTSLLAEYVDDALAPSERKRVEAHLSSCDECSREVADATAARDALGSLGLEEVPVGVTSSVIQQASAGPGRVPSPAAVQLRPAARKSRYSGLYKVMAAAAAVVIVGAFATSLFGRDKAELASTGASPQDFMEVQDADPGRFDRDGNYTAGELAAFAEREAKAFGQEPVPMESAEEPAASASPAASGYPATAGGAVEAPAKDASDSSLTRALPAGVQPIADRGRYRKCLDTIGAYDHGGELVSSFEGKYLDAPAYFATLAEGPDAGSPHDRLVVWVLRRDDCWVLAFTQQRFPSATPSPLPTDYMHPVP